MKGKNKRQEERPERPEREEPQDRTEQEGLDANPRPSENSSPHLAMLVTDLLKQGQKVVLVMSRAQTQVELASQGWASR